MDITKTVLASIILLIGIWALFGPTISRIFSVFSLSKLVHGTTDEPVQRKKDLMVEILDLIIATDSIGATNTTDKLREALNVFVDDTFEYKGEYAHPGVITEKQKS